MHLERPLFDSLMEAVTDSSWPEADIAGDWFSAFGGRAQQSKPIRLIATRWTEYRCTVPARAGLGLCLASPFCSHPRPRTPGAEIEATRNAPGDRAIECARILAHALSDLASSPHVRTRMTAFLWIPSFALKVATALSRVATLPMFVRSRPSRTRCTISFNWARYRTITAGVALGKQASGSERHMGDARTRGRALDATCVWRMPERHRADTRGHSTWARFYGCSCSPQRRIDEAGQPASNAPRSQWLRTASAGPSYVTTSKRQARCACCGWEASHCCAALTSLDCLPGVTDAEASPCEALFR